MPKLAKQLISAHVNRVLILVQCKSYPTWLNKQTNKASKKIMLVPEQLFHNSFKV